MNNKKKGMYDLENAENLEIIAQKNLDIAENERLICKDSKMKVKQDLKSAKAREILVKNEIELAKLNHRLAEKSKKLIERKGEVKDILNFSNNNLKTEEDYAIYNIKIAGIKNTIAEVQRKVAYLNRQIAEEELKIINEKLKVAKEREILGKKQFNYVKLMKISPPREKLIQAEADYLNHQKKLNKAIKDVFEKSIEIRRKEDKLADLKKELSEELAEREKIRPPIGKFPTNM
ncbi:MAG: hypothetical protein ACFFCL_06850 [Promethearchaeota archaeon]